MFESDGVRSLLDQAAAMERRKSWCDAQRFAFLADYGNLHTEVPEALVPGAARLVQVGGDGTPPVDEFCLSEFAATAKLSEDAARAQLAVALDLRYRLPRVWQSLREGQIPGWRARMVCEATRMLSLAQARVAEARLMPYLVGLGARRLADLVRQVVIDTDPAAADDGAEQAKERRHVTLDPEDDHGLVTGAFCADPGDGLRFAAAVDRIADWLGHLGDTDAKPVRRAKALGYLANPQQALALMRRATGSAGAASATTRGGAVPGDTDDAGVGPWPEATLYVHLTHDQFTGHRDGGATLEGVGPVTLTRARDLLGHAHVTVRPVIDLENMPSSDDRFVRGLMREAMVLKNPHCPFPHCSRNARRNQGDHTVPWPKGKTAIDNLSPPCGKHHRAKTHAGWDLVQAVNGVYVWTSPQGRVYLVDRRGITHDLGLPPTG